MSNVQPTEGGGNFVLAFDSDQSHANRRRLAIADVVEATGLWRLCWTLAWLDIRLRYRGSILGPLWLTLSTGLMVAAMAIEAGRCEVALITYGSVPKKRTQP